MTTLAAMIIIFFMLLMQVGGQIMTKSVSIECHCQGTTYLLKTCAYKSFEHGVRTPLVWLMADNDLIDDG